MQSKQKFVRGRANRGLLVTEKKAIGKKDTFSISQFQGTYRHRGTVVRRQEVFTCISILE